MKVIFHIGTEKTGSKSIQEFLYLNQKELKKQKVTTLRSLGLKNHRKISVLCMDESQSDSYTKEHGIDGRYQRRKWRHGIAKSLRGELRQCGKWASTVIVSSEHLHSRLSSKKEVVRLKNIFSEFASELQVVLYLRRQDLLSVSLDSTRVSLHGRNSSILNVNSNHHQYYNYYELYTLWESVFDKKNITINVFEPELFYKGSLILDFLKSCELDFSSQYKFPRVMNKNISSNVREFYVWFNKSKPSLSTYDKALKHYIVEKLNVDGCTMSRALPGRDQARQFYDRFQYSNSELAKLYFNRDKLFTEDFSMYPKEPNLKPFSKEMQTLTINYENEFKRKIRFFPDLRDYSVRLYYYHRLPKLIRRFIYNLLR